MKIKLAVTFVSAAMLVACSGGDSNNAAESDAQKAQETAAKQSSAVDKVVEKAKEEAAKIAESIKLDMSSVDSFKSSLASMKSSLSGADQGKLTDALKSLAKDSVKEGDGLLGAAKGLASGKSTEDILYDKMKSKLDGLSFDDILALAN